MIIDILYIAGTLAFFAGMLAYVRGCERLGRHADREPTPCSSVTRARY